MWFYEVWPKISN